MTPVSFLLSGLLLASGLAPVHPVAPAHPGGPADSVAPPTGRLEQARVPAPSLLGALLGSSAVRRTTVYLPPSYDDDDDRRYPVLYLLHAFGSGPESWLGVSGFEGLNIAQALDALAASDPSREFIVVMPDARTVLGGSWYTNSPVTGRWTDFIARDLVSFVDRAYRTQATASARGIAGHAMGGYGALRVALWYPGTFGAVVALSSPNLVTTNPFGVAGVRMALEVPDLSLLELSDPVARLMWSKAAAFAPDPGHPPFYGRLPWREAEEGRLEHDPTGWPAWEESALATHLATRGNALLDIPVRVEVGRRDPLRDESEAFAEALRAVGVRPRLELFDGAHIRGVRRQLEESVLPFFARVLNESGDPGMAPAGSR
jgi:S-formylglutathione hydrolase FrmB